MKVFTFFILALLVLTPISYYLLLGINNVVWAFKGLKYDKDSAEYEKRKFILKVLALPTAIVILYLI
jgi:hypothetical protein